MLFELSAKISRAHLRWNLSSLCPIHVHPCGKLVSTDSLYEISCSFLRFA